jgi:hypothetical protein
MKKPRKVDIPVVFALKNGLLAITLVHMLLGIIESWSPNAASVRIQRKMQEAELYDEHQRAREPARLLLAGIEQSISLTNRVDDIRTLSSTGLRCCCAAYKLTNEFMIPSVYFSVSVIIYGVCVGIRLFKMVSISSTCLLTI